MRRRASAGLAGICLALAGVSSARAQTTPGVVTAAFGGGNGETWREMVAKPFTVLKSKLYEPDF